MTQTELLHKIVEEFEKHNQLQGELVDIFKSGQKTQQDQIAAGLNALEVKMKEEIVKATRKKR